MKRQIFDLLMLGLLVGLAIGSAHAQSTIARIHVPFDFVMGDTRPSAGKYTITSAAPGVMPELLLFRDTKGQVREVSMGIRIEPSNNSSKVAKLIFQHYGARYFLSQVWLTAGESGCQIRKGSQEKELAEREAGVQTAVALASAR